MLRGDGEITSHTRLYLIEKVLEFSACAKYMYRGYFADWSKFAGGVVCRPPIQRIAREWATGGANPVCRLE